ncbi:MAG: AAA-associated domain-containing protein [Actinobacteria bacterium]|nr:AAA-associated domain-containing protein [Actinomycetota bacterium]
MAIEPLPKATIGEIIGLLEFLNDFKSQKEDLFELAKMLNMDIDEFSPIVDAAEILGFVRIEDGDIILTEIGKKFIDADINERKLIFKERLKKVKIFKDLLKFLHTNKDLMADREKVTELFEEELTHEDAEKLLNVIIDWGRFAELLGYNADAEEIYIDQE